MGNIKLLDRATIDKIAAGEVVERPISIVKELLENSIDAGSKKVEIEIKNAGKSYIRVTDNGSGILEDDIDLIFKRHATSKIRVIEDLYCANTLGFRGEALSSIAAVSKVRLASRSVSCDVGFSIALNAGEVIKKESVSLSTGTTIELSDLFYNTPVRLKFLKSDITEANSIVDIVERLALLRPDISFKLINNGKEIINTIGSSSLKDVIFDIYKKDVYDNLLEIDADLGLGKLKGYIGTPAIARGNRNRQSFFINGRYIKSYLLMKAVSEGYTSFLMQHQFPFFVLNLQLNPSSVDVNIHPSKMEVSFEDSNAVYRQIYHAVRERLNALTTEDVREISLETDLSESAYSSDNKESDQNSFIKSGTDGKNRNFYLSESRLGSTVDNSGLEIISNSLNDEIYNNLKDDNPSCMIANERVSEFDLSGKNADFEQISILDEKNLDNSNEIRVLGQLFSTYIIAQIDDKMYIIDQHAAHEKINFERFIKNLNQINIVSQQLVIPVVLNLSRAEMQTIKRFADVFFNIGFEIEEFGIDSYIIRAVPASFFKMDIEILFMELLDNLNDIYDIKNIENIKDRVANVACKASIKAGNILSNSEAESLIKELLKLDAPFNCPHGRPTMITMSRYELEKKFKRIV